MHKCKKEIEIMKRYKTFIKPQKGLSKTFMVFGFECGEGWFHILENLFVSIEKLNPPKEFEILQIKEKFGGLRIYTSCSIEEIDKLIEEAEKQSLITCKKCGNPGSQRNDGWIKTLCDKCAIKMKKS